MTSPAQAVAVGEAMMASGAAWDIAIAPPAPTSAATRRTGRLPWSAVVGIGVLINNWAALAVLTGAVACGLAFRIRIEERALLQDLGESYREYAATHKRLIPYVW